MMLKASILALCLLAAASVHAQVTVQDSTTDLPSTLFIVEETTTGEPATEEETTTVSSSTTTTAVIADCVVDASGNYIPDGIGLCTCGTGATFAQSLNAFWRTLMCNSCPVLPESIKLAVCPLPPTTTTTTPTTTTTAPTTTTTKATTTTTTPATTTTQTTTTTADAASSSSSTTAAEQPGICPGTYVCRCKTHTKLIWIPDEFGCVTCRCEWLEGYGPQPSTASTAAPPTTATTRRTTAPRITTTAAPASTPATTAAPATVRTTYRFTTRPAVVTTTRPAPPAVIVPGAWNTFNSHQYKFFSTPATWYEAELACRREFGQLVSVHNEEENKFVFKVSGQNELQSVWLGAQLSQWGWYNWRDGTGWDFDTWAIGEPDTNEKSGCVYMGHKVNGQKSDWFNGQCTKTHAFVCKRAL